MTHHQHAPDCLVWNAPPGSPLALCDCGVASRAAADEAMDRAAANAHDQWAAAAFDAVARCASLGTPFTTDDVWAIMPDDVETHDSRAMGPVIRSAVREGLIQKTGHYRTTTRKVAHACPKTEWIGRDDA